MPTATRRSGLLSITVAAIVLAAACSTDGTQPTAAGSPPPDAAAASTAPPSTPSPTVSSVATILTLDGEPIEATDSVRTTASMYTADASRADLREFPPADLPLDPESEIAVGAPDLVGLRRGGRWLFASVPPSVVVRVDPETGDVERLDLELGESPEGAARLAYVDGSLWVLGGPFRDTLVEVDPASMTEVRRIQLGDDHGIRQAGPDDELWLSTFRGVRPVDVEHGEAGEAISLEVDPGGIAIGDAAVWVALPAAAQIARIGTGDGLVDLFDTEPGPAGVAVGDGVVWVAHPPTASLSRIDADTGEVRGVSDLDLGGDQATVTNVPGLAVTGDGVWAFLRLDGSAHRPVLVRIDPGTGEIAAARTVQVDGNSWVATPDRIWFHRRETGSIVAVDLDDFDAAPPVDMSELATGSTPASTSTVDGSAPTADEREVAAAFERFVDPAVESPELALGPLATVRDGLLGLLGAQVGGEARLTGVMVAGDTGEARFDVVVEGDTIVVPDLRFVFERRPGSPPWVITESSLCEVAEGVGVACP